MAENDGSFDLDMAMMDDSALIVLAQECDYRPARDELIVRYANQRDRLIRWLASSTEFKIVDVEDACQNAVFWTVEAINKYDTEQIVKERGCSFYTFLNHVVVRRFKDYCKSLRRKERPYDRTFDPQTPEAFSNSAGQPTNDPATIAESQEAQTCLYAAIAQMDGQSCRIWELLVEGNNLREISVELGISYDAVKRRRRKLITHLTSRLKPPD